MKSKKGITLIALVITIVILLILVAVSIGLFGNNGIIERTHWSTYVTEYQAVEEAKQMYIMENQIKDVRKYI